MRPALAICCVLSVACFPKVDIVDSAELDDGGSDGSIDWADTSGDGSSGDGSSGDGSSGDGSSGDGSSGGDGGDSSCTAWADTDGDGYGAGAEVEVEDCDALPSGYVTNSDDCDDSDAAVHPMASEVCNGIDDDCDSAVDDADDSLDLSTASTWYIDGDGDGYGDASSSTTACGSPGGYADNTDDCDDADSAVHPAASEICNGIDDDCDTVVDSAAACPCNLETNGGHTYLFCETASTWHAAEAACEAVPNYTLAVITDATEQAWVWATASSYSSRHWWWLGLHNQSASSSQEPADGFEWVDGSTVSYTEWYPYHPWPQPDDAWGNEDCVHIDPSHGFWNDLDCALDDWYGTDIYYICESGSP